MKETGKAKQEDSEPRQLCAVYCTADIPLETLNKFLEKSVIKSDHLEEPLAEACLIEDTKNSFFDHPAATNIPVQTSPSAYRGASVDGLIRRFNGEFSTFRNSKPKFRDLEIRINNVQYMESGFVVLDKQTLEDGSSLSVEIVLDEVTTLRTSFDFAIQVLQATELGMAPLNEGYFSPWVGTGKIVDADAVYEQYGRDT